MIGAFFFSQKSLDKTPILAALDRWKYRKAYLATPTIFPGSARRAVL
jgi:hypothetical protein